MKQLGKFLSLTGEKRYFLISALLYLVIIKIELWVFPFRRLFRRLEQAAVRGDCVVRSNSMPPEEIAWAIRSASRYVPGARNCLVQAFATQAMLTRYGFPAHLRIGVAKDQAGQLKAHAWVECKGKIIIGGVDVSKYTPLGRVHSQTNFYD